MESLAKPFPKAFFPRAILACLLALVLIMGADNTVAYAQDISAEAETDVSFTCTSLTPLVRVSRSHETGATIDQGDDLRLEALFKGGEGKLIHRWSVSKDGGSNFAPLPTTTSVHTIENAQALPKNAPYIYRLHTNDESIQRLETLYTITVIAPDNPISPSPSPTPASDPGTSPDSPDRGGGGKVPTGDFLGAFAVFTAGVFLSSLILLALAKRRSHSREI